MGSEGITSLNRASLCQEQLDDALRSVLGVQRERSILHLLVQRAPTPDIMEAGVQAGLKYESIVRIHDLVCIICLALRLLNCVEAGRRPLLTMVFIYELGFTIS